MKKNQLIFIKEDAMNTNLMMTGYVAGMAVVVAKKLVEVKIKEQLAFLAIDCVRELVKKPEQDDDTKKGLTKVDVGEHSLRRIN